MQWLHWSVLGSALVVLLIATLWIWIKLWQSRRQLAQQHKQQKTDLIASIKIISSAMLKGRLELVDGCHRLVPLLDQLSLHWREIPSLRVIGQIEQLGELQRHPEEAGKLHDLCQEAALARQLQASEVHRALNWLLQHNQTGYARVLEQLKPHS